MSQKKEVAIDANVKAYVDKEIEKALGKKVSQKQKKANEKKS